MIANTNHEDTKQKAIKLQKKHHHLEKRAEKQNPNIQNQTPQRWDILSNTLYTKCKYTNQTKPTQIKQTLYTNISILDAQKHNIEINPQKKSQKKKKKKKT